MSTPTWRCATGCHPPLSPPLPSLGDSLGHALGGFWVWASVSSSTSAGSCNLQTWNLPCEAKYGSMMEHDCKWLWGQTAPSHVSVLHFPRPHWALSQPPRRTHSQGRPQEWPWLQPPWPAKTYAAYVGRVVCEFGNGPGWSHQQSDHPGSVDLPMGTLRKSSKRSSTCPVVWATIWWWLWSNILSFSHGSWNWMEAIPAGIIFLELIILRQTTATNQHTCRICQIQNWDIWDIWGQSRAVDHVRIVGLKPIVQCSTNDLTDLAGRGKTWDTSLAETPKRWSPRSHWPWEVCCFSSKSNHRALWLKGSKSKL